MAPTTPYYNFGAPEDAAALPGTAAEMAARAVAPARSRLRRQAAGKQQAAGGSGGGGVAVTPKKAPQRGLGVAELERLRCGGDPLHDVNTAAAAAMLEAAAAANAAAKLQVQQGHALFLQQQQQQLLQNHDYLPAFDAATGSRYYSPLLVQPPPAPPAPVRYAQDVVPQQQQYFVDRWGRMGGFVSAANAAGGAHPSQLQAPAPPPENRSSQTTIWRPAFYSDESCLHSSQRCDLCTKAMMALASTGARANATATSAAVAAPDNSIYDLSAAMNTGRKETAGEGLMAPPEGRKEVREIEFFPTRTTSDGGGVVGPDGSELGRTPPLSSSSPPGGEGGSTAPLDLSLKL